MAGLEKMVEARLIVCAIEDYPQRFPYMWKEHLFVKSTRSVEDSDLLLQKVPMPFRMMTGPEYFDLPAVLPQEC